MAVNDYLRDPHGTLPYLCNPKGGFMFLYALSGQSNMVFLNPRSSFVPAMATGMGTSDIRVAKRAWSGNPIANWSPDDPASHFGRLVNKINRVAGGDPCSGAGIVWMQGEKDAMLGTPKDSYWTAAATMLGRLREQMMADLRVKRVPIVIGRISDHLAGDILWDAIREAQEDLALGLDDAALVDTDDLNLGVHYFTVNGYKILGERFASAMLSLR